jgi:hypothetical protein
VLKNHKLYNSFFKDFCHEGINCIAWLTEHLVHCATRRI